MKPLIIAASILSIGGLPLTAQVTERSTDVSQNTDGSITKTETTTTFNPEARTKVIKYFDAYKGDPNGLPPGWASKIRVKDVPVAWRTSVTPGIMVQESDRVHLVAAPPELIKVLPTPASGVRYYIAGSNIVAVDANYRVVDSIAIPYIKYAMD